MPGQALPQPSCSTTRRSFPRRGCAGPLLQSSPATSVLQYELHPWRRPRRCQNLAHGGTCSYHENVRTL